MTYHYLILGAGKQGTAAGYDLVRFGDATRVIMADMHLAQAEQATARINRLTNTTLAHAQQIDVTDATALRTLLEDIDVALSAVPYSFNLEITQACLDTQTHLCDMGGNTDVVFAQLRMGEKAQAKQISIVPDCGMMPGLANTMAAYLIAQFDEPEDILIYDGGIPQTPQPPWNYELFFHVNGLTNEYSGETAFLRGGELVMVSGLTEHEVLDIPPLGQVEAFVTTGGTSTSPYTWQGKLQTYQNKTIRWPGHFAWFEGYRALGLFEETPHVLGDMSFVPREIFHALLMAQLPHQDLRDDVCVIHVIGHGRIAGVQKTLTMSLVDYYDPETEFLAMERLTGWHCAIMMGFQARGNVRAGGVAMETAVPPEIFMEALATRGITFTLR
jgi:lysine 6-dehydrogenase